MVWVFLVWFLFRHILKLRHGEVSALPQVHPSPAPGEHSLGQSLMQLPLAVPHGTLTPPFSPLGCAHISRLLEGDYPLVALGSIWM